MANMTRAGYTSRPTFGIFCEHPKVDQPYRGEETVIMTMPEGFWTLGVRPTEECYALATPLRQIAQVSET